MANGTCDYCGEEMEMSKLQPIGHCHACAPCAALEAAAQEIAETADYCSACSGSGEGMYDGTRCHFCGGTGVAK